MRECCRQGQAEVRLEVKLEVRYTTHLSSLTLPSAALGPRLRGAAFRNVAYADEASEGTVRRQEVVAYKVRETGIGYRAI